MGAAGDFDMATTWAGEGIDLIGDVPPAAELVQRTGTEAERSLRTAPGLIV